MDNEDDNLYPPESSNTMLQEYWKNMWESNDTEFHQLTAHPDLVKYELLLLKPNSRVYIPLCGKSVDLVYLADKGHDVYGSEFVEMAIKDFFKEQNLEFIMSKDPSSGVVIYKAVSKKVTIYQGNFFTLKADVIGKFDAIWDRAAIVAINPSQRDKYAKVILDIMAPGCKCLLNLLVITGKEYRGPAHSVTDKSIQNLFGNFCEIKSLEATTFPFNHPKAESINFNNKLLSLK